MRFSPAALLLCVCSIASAQPELIEPAAVLHSGDGQLIVTGEIIYQGRRAPSDVMVVVAELPRSSGVATCLASAPVEVGTFVLTPGAEARVRPGSIVTLRVVEGDRVAILEHMRVEDAPPPAPARVAAAEPQVAERTPPLQPDRRAGGMYIGYRMRNRSSGTVMPGRGHAGRTSGVEFDVVVGGGGNFNANFTFQ